MLSAPFVYLAVMPKLKQMDPSLYEAALDLGATPVYALFKIIIPQIASGIASGFVMALHYHWMIISLQHTLSLQHLTQ